MGIPPLEEALFRYYVDLPADWEAAVDGKMPGLAGNVDVLGAPSGTSGGGAYDARSWSGRVMWNNEEFDTVPSRATPRTYLYVASVGGESIDAHRDERPTGSTGSSARGRTAPASRCTWSSARGT